MQRSTVDIAYSHRAMTDDDQDVSDDLVVVDIIIETRYTQNSFMDLVITTSY